MGLITSFTRPTRFASFPFRADSIYDPTTMIPGSTSAALTMTANRLVAVPVAIETPVTIAQIGVECTGAGATNGRFGVYAAGSDGFPGSLILDAGVVDSFGSTGFKNVTGLTQRLTPGQFPWVWIALVTDGTPAIRGYTPDRGVLGIDGQQAYGYVYVAHTYGALPATFGAYTRATASTPRIYIRTAA